MIALPEIFARVRRLEELERGGPRKSASGAGGIASLLEMERRHDVNPLQDALTALEEARVVLARAGKRVASREGDHGT